MKCLVVVFGMSLAMVMVTTTPVFAGGEKVTICHNGKTIEVSQKAVAKHIEEHGDTEGSCPGTSLKSSKKVAICHKGKTKEVSEKTATKHFAKHGDTVGPCSE